MAGDATEKKFRFADICLAEGPRLIPGGGAKNRFGRRGRQVIDISRQHIVMTSGLIQASVSVAPARESAPTGFTACVIRTVRPGMTTAPGRSG